MSTNIKIPKFCQFCGQAFVAQTTNFINLRDKEFLSVQEAAILLGASRWTIQRMINQRIKSF